MKRSFVIEKLEISKILILLDNCFTKFSNDFVELFIIFHSDISIDCDWNGCKIWKRCYVFDDNENFI
jgi:leucyl-tRNA synthetase